MIQHLKKMHSLLAGRRADLATQKTIPEKNLYFYTIWTHASNNGDLVEDHNALVQSISDEYARRGSKTSYTPESRKYISDKLHETMSEYYPKDAIRLQEKKNAERSRFDPELETGYRNKQQQFRNEDMSAVREASIQVPKPTTYDEKPESAQLDRVRELKIQGNTGDAKALSRHVSENKRRELDYMPTKPYEGNELPRVGQNQSFQRNLSTNIPSPKDSTPPLYDFKKQQKIH